MGRASSQRETSAGIIDSVEGLVEVELELEEKRGLKGKFEELRNNKEIRDEFIRYILVGVASASIEFSLFAIGDRVLVFPITLSNFIAQGTAVTVNFLLSQFWTFKVGGNPKSIARNALFYVLLFTANNIVSTAGIHLLIAAGLSSLLAKFLVMGLAVIWNFLLYRSVIFKKKQSD